MNLNLLHLFTFYLAAMFVIGTMRRLQQYQEIARIVLAAPGRWPRVLQQIKKNWLIFATWTTFRPAAIAVGLLIVQTICSRLIWPQAAITVHELLDEWWMLIPIGLAAVGMVGVDVYFLYAVGAINSEEAGKYLDEAEHWLTSWKAPLISTVTFGFINPRAIVDTEVKKALEDGKGLLNSALWWMAAQTALRITYGLMLWISWAVHG